MKKFPLIILLLMLLLPVAFSSCKDDVDNSVSKEYAAWKKANDEWLLSQQNRKDSYGNDYYTEVVAPWDPNSKVYVHWNNDRSLTRDNLSPLFTSTVDVKYKGMYYNDEPFDSSYLRTTPAPGVFRTKITSVIEGWGVALCAMKVGDNCRVVIPYNVGYGTTKYGSINPYSVLQFDIELVDVPKLELKAPRR